MNLTETFGKEKYYSLDFMRGVAALIVATAHYADYGGYGKPFMAGELCVAYFFMLSGFVLTHAYRTQIYNGFYKFHDFLVMRIARLYPLHFLTFFLISMYWLFLGLLSHFGFSIVTQKDWSLLNIFENLTLTTFIFSDQSPMNSPAWSISVEFWCSFFLFFLCLPINKFYKAIPIGLSIVFYCLTLPSGGFINAKMQYSYGFIEKNYAAGFFLFFIRWTLYFIKNCLLSYHLHIPKSVPWMIVLLLCALVIWPPFLDNDYSWIEVPYYLLIAISILLLSYVQPQNKLLCQMMGRVGDISYGIYLWHVPIMLGLVAISKIIFIKYGYNFLPTPLGILTYFALILGVASVSYRCFEIPAKKFIRSKFGHERVYCSKA